MKRLAFNIFLVVFLSIVCVSAAEHQELTFQNIPWYSSPEESCQFLIDLGFIDSMPSKTKIEKINNAEGTLRDSHIARDKSKAVPYTIKSGKATPLTEKLQLLTFSGHMIQKTIAQQELSWIHFLYTLEPQNPQLVECYIDFKAKKFDQKAVYNALVEKYGKPSETKDKKKVHVWLGDNNTIIVMRDRIVAFATIDGLTLADSFSLPKTEKDDTGF